MGYTAAGSNMGYTANGHPFAVVDEMSAKDEAYHAIVYDDNGTYRAIGRAGQIDAGTDVGSVLNTVINGLSTGAKIGITEGTFNCATTIDMRDDLVIEGSGDGTFIQDNGVSGELVSTNNSNRVAIRDLELDAQGNNIRCIDAPASDWVEISNVRCDAPDVGIRLHGNSTAGVYFARITDCEVRNATIPVLMHAENNSVNQNVIRGGDLRTDTDNEAAVEIRCNNGNNAQGNVVRDANLANEGNGADQAGVHLETNDSSDGLSRTAVYGCWIEVSDDGTGSTGSHGLRTTAASGSTLNRVMYLPVQDNTDNGFESADLTRYFRITGGGSEVHHRTLNFPFASDSVSWPDTSLTEDSNFDILASSAHFRPEFGLGVRGGRTPGIEASGQVASNSLQLQANGGSRVEVLDGGGLMCVTQRGSDPGTSDMNDGDVAVYVSDGTSGVTGAEGDWVYATNDGGSTIKTAVIQAVSGAS